MMQKKIGRYNLTKEIGKGGMGVVYQATDSDLSREVAIKVLSKTLTNDDHFVARFQREARMIAQLEHPHIVPIYDVGEANGDFYIVMRLLEGGTLREKSVDANFEDQHLFQALSQVSAGLDYAHQKGIVHRDIKPSNVLFDNQGIAYISDFGIAKNSDSNTQLTQNHVLGTPAYMSPEQFTGENVTGKSDGYSFAIVAYEMLLGDLPFEGTTLQMMYKHVHEPPNLNPLKQNYAYLVPTLAKALDKEPNKRFSTLAEFSKALSAKGESSTGPLQSKRQPAARLTDPVTPIPTLDTEKPRNNIAPSPIPLRNDQAKTKIRKGAGGTESTRIAIRPNRRKWLWIAPLLLISLVGMGFLGSQLLGESRSEVLIKAPTSLPLPAEGSTKSSEIKLVGDVDQILLEIDGDLSRVPDTGILNLRNSDSELMIQTAADPVSILFQDRATINLAQNSAITFLDNSGSFLINDGQLAASVNNDGEGLIINNSYGGKVTLVAGTLVGIISSEEPYLFDVHCFSGNCKVTGDVEGEVTLSAGEEVQIGLNGKPGSLASADYGAFSLVSDLVPTPTPTTVPEPTETLVATVDETSSAEALETHESTEVAQPTATGTSVAIVEAVATATRSAANTPTPKSSPTATSNTTPTPTTLGGSENPNGIRIGDGIPIRFENGNIWGIGQQKNGTLSRATDKSHAGGASGRLDYSFNTDENDYVVFLQLNEVSGQPNRISVWVHGDGSDHFANVWIQDSAGQVWQVPLGQVFHTGWRKMTGRIDVDQDWPWSSISGPDNDQVDYPIQFYAFVLDDFSQTFVGDGTIYIDDIELYFSENPEATEAPAIPVAQAIEERAAPSLTATPSAEVPALEGNVGRILYTSGNTLLTADPSWGIPLELGTASSNSCNNNPTLITGQSFGVYRGYFCGLSGPSTCQSPNGQMELVLNVQNREMTVNLRAVGDETNGEFIYSGSVDASEGMQWSPDSQSFVWVVADTMFRGFVSGGYQQLFAPVYNPIIGTDSQTVLYRKPVGPGVNDVWIARLDGSSETNITNNLSIDKKCAVWTTGN